MDDNDSNYVPFVDYFLASYTLSLIKDSKEPTLQVVELSKSKKGKKGEIG